MELRTHVRQERILQDIDDLADVGQLVLAYVLGSSSSSNSIWEGIWWKSNVFSILTCKPGRETPPWEPSHYVTDTACISGHICWMDHLLPTTQIIFIDRTRSVPPTSNSTNLSRYPLSLGSTCLGKGRTGAEGARTPPATSGRRYCGGWSEAPAVACFSPALPVVEKIVPRVVFSLDGLIVFLVVTGKEVLRQACLPVPARLEDAQINTCKIYH